MLREVRMKREITYFESVKQDHTDDVFALVKASATELGIRHVVLASTTGRTALRAMEAFEGTGVTLVVVPHQFGFSAEENRFDGDTVARLTAAGHIVHFGTMLFHTDKLFGEGAQSVAANFLRCFCEGVKVCYEISLMAADGGCVHPGERIIAVAGTGANADTAMVLQAATTRSLGNLRINELLCKPYSRGE